LGQDKGAVQDVIVGGFAGPLLCGTKSLSKGEAMATPGVCLLLWMSLLCAAEGTPAKSKVVFKAETVKVFIANSSVRVEGTYIFTGSSSSSLVAGLFYPFPIDSTHTFPDSIMVSSNGHTLPFRTVENGIFFSIRLSADHLTTVEVNYDQPCLDNTACYILTTTEAWTNPLESANFEIHVPSDLNLIWIAYEVDEVAEENDMVVHRFARSDFMPDKDLCLRWHTRPRYLTK
jgi:hypothetical protein